MNYKKPIEHLIKYAELEEIIKILINLSKYYYFMEIPQIPNLIYYAIPFFFVTVIF